MQTMVVFCDRTRSFRCAGCLGQPHEVPKSVMRNPEELMRMREQVEEEHSECPGYDSPRLALTNRMTKRRIARENAKIRHIPPQTSGSWASA